MWWHRRALLLSPAPLQHKKHHKVLKSGAMAVGLHGAGFSQCLPMASSRDAPGSVRGGGRGAQRPPILRAWFPGPPRQSWSPCTVSAPHRACNTVPVTTVPQWAGRGRGSSTSVPGSPRLAGGLCPCTCALCRDLEIAGVPQSSSGINALFQIRMP